jgi:hypothetical protein
MGPGRGRFLDLLGAETISEIEEAGGKFVAGNGLDVALIQFNCNTLHDLLYRQHDSEAALPAHHDSFHPGVCTSTIA